MSYYPLFLRLSGLKVLLAGAGPVGRRRAADLLVCRPAQLLWLDPGFSLAEVARFPEFERPEFAGGLSGWPGLIYEQRPLRPEDVPGRHLAFAATNVRRVNEMLAGLCADSGVLCNVADAPCDGAFVVPAHFRRGDIVLALCTGGQSPALSGRLRRDLEAWFGKKYVPLLTVMGRLRPLVLGYAAFGGPGGGSPAESGCAPSCQDKQTGAAAMIFRSLIDSPLAETLADGDLAAAGRVLLEVLPPQLHDCIGDVLYEPF